MMQFPCYKFLGGFLPVSRDLFDECKKYGQFKSGTSGYWLNSPVRLKEEKRSMRPFDSHVAYMKWNAEEVCLPPREKFRIEVYIRIIDKSMNQSTKIYIAPLKDLYPEALPTQAKGPSIKYVTLEGGGGPRRCDSL